ncbi:hypothetical protein REPUB_Repub05bG0207800 [Reevesia pubescens]
MREGKSNEARKRRKKRGDPKSLTAYFKQKRPTTQSIKTLNLEVEGSNQEEEIRESENQNKGKHGKGFFACYLLTSLSPRHKGHTYIGFTVNPRRRIRQHNGEIGSGAWRTKSRRPWEMVVCIHGFPTNVSALQFEWAWQHPQESVAVRQAAATFRSFSGVANKIKLAHTMLTLPAWQSLNITVNYFSTKYTNHSACCPSLPEQMKVQVCSMDELPCYTEQDEFEYKDDCDNLDEYDEVNDACDTVQETYPDEVVNVSADNLHSSIHERSREQFEHIEESETGKLVDLSTLGVRNKESHVSIDSPTSKATSVATGLPMVEVVEWADMSTIGRESLKEKQFMHVVESDEDPEPRDLSTLGVRNKESHVSIDSPTSKATSVATGLPMVEVVEWADMSTLGRESLKEKQFTYVVESDEDPEPWVREKLSTTYEKLGDSSTFGVYHTLPFDVTPVKASSSIFTGLSNGETVEGAKICITGKECPNQRQFAANGDQQPWTREKLLTTEFAVMEDQIPSSTVAQEVEVIDLLTPAPDCRVRSHSKKRRISMLSPEIIDLT